MKLVTPLEELAHVVDELERNDVQVEEASASHSNDGRVRARVRIEIPISAPEEDDSVDDVVEAAREVVSPVETVGEEPATDQEALDVYDSGDLQEAYDAHHSIAAAAEEFDASYDYVYQRMVEEGVHEVVSDSNPKDEILEALAGGDEALTHKEIKLQAGLSDGQWTTAARKLRESGEIVRARNPDDGRQFVYALDEDLLPDDADETNQQVSNGDGSGNNDPGPAARTTEEDVIELIETEGEIPSGDINEKLGYGRSTTPKPLKRLLECGSIDRRPDPSNPRRFIYSLAGGVESAPERLSPADVYDAAEESDSVDAVAETLGVDADTAGELLESHGLTSKISEAVAE